MLLMYLMCLVAVTLLFQLLANHALQLSLYLTLACIRLALISVTLFQKLACCSIASDSTRENMLANKLTGEAHMYTIPRMQLGCFTFNTQENMHADKLTGKTHVHTQFHTCICSAYVTSERICFSSLITLNTNLIKNLHVP